jgi:predicted amidohydrolase
MNPDTTMSVMYRLATQLNVHLVFGFVELDPGTGRLYNSQCYIAPDGTYACYQKLNRFGNDFIWAEAGKSNPPVIDSPDLGLRVGLLVCRDVRDKVNDKWTDLYSPGDADVVCLSANWGDGGFPAISWMDFVSENKTSLIVSNRYGQETCNNFGEGGICVINKAGKVFCDGLQWNQDCVVYGEL